MRKVVYDDEPDIRAEEALFSRVLEPHRAEIGEIREAYKLLIVIINSLKQSFPAIDSQLNTYYIDLFGLVIRNKKVIEDEIYDRYNASDGPNMPGMPDSFIHTNIFEHFYRPFETLYEVQSKKPEWDGIIGKMSLFYNQLEEIYHKYSTVDIKDLPNQRLLQEIQDYLKSSTKIETLECSGLVIDFKKGSLTYKTHPPKEIPLNNEPVKFLISLMQHKGEIVEHTTIAKELNLNFYTSDIKNNDAAENTRYLKRNLRSLLLGIGMSKHEFDQLITSQKKLGYKINCF